jgi:DNA-binding NtrC family response regulator
MTGLSGKRILVIEDEAIIAEMVEEMLTQLETIVVGPAGTLAKGIELARNEAIDAAVLDVNIRSERVDPIAETLIKRHIPFVFATGYGDAFGAGNGRAPVLEKPFTMERLANALTAAIKANANALG